MDHLMIDLETLGTGPNSVFLSLAAVQFSLEDGKIGDYFRQNVEIQSALNAGLQVDGATVEWWTTQRPEIMRLMFVDPTPLLHVLNRFALFFRTVNAQYIWGNSARFDLGILENAYKKLNVTVPWGYRNERCYRTVIGLFPPLDEEYLLAANGLDAHNPVHDCLKQVKLLTTTWKNIQNGTYVG